MGGIGDITQIILYVSDMDKMVAYYRDALGLKLSEPRGLNYYGDQFWVEFDTGSCTLALSGGGAVVELVGEYAPKFVFKVRKIEERRTELIERGVKLGAVRTPAEGVFVVDGSDPEGNKFALVEHA